MPTARSVPSVATFLHDIDSFKARHGLSDTQIGDRALRSHPFLGRVRKGRLIPRLDTVERVYRWMADYERAAERDLKAGVELLQMLEEYHRERDRDAARAARHNRKREALSISAH